MIAVNIRKIFESESGVQQHIRELTKLGVSNMHKDLKHLLEEMKLPPQTSWEALVKAIHDNALTHEHFSNILRNHWVGYFGEIAVHTLLGEPWRLVFKFNDVNVWPHQPDGFIGAQPYNVKTRVKNKWGLTFKETTLKESFYVLGLNAAHENSVHLIGYATADELLQNPRDRFTNFWCKREELHPIEYFKPGIVSEGLKHRCGSSWNALSNSLP
ncbi:MAG: hypothetical protein ABSB89_04025 [Candidatus Bathyarchaeia archaeon]|jgi:hypothetical protein